MYNGWTPEPEYRAEAKQALRLCEQAMGKDAYVRWYFEEINMLQGWKAVLDAANDWLNGDDCCHCNDDMCKCTYHNQEIPY